jgi:AcrR family transcriptional regulator
MTRADAERNRGRVLAAASSLLAEHGAGVPLDEIARRAGVGPGTVYRHFPSKEALLDAVVLTRLEDLAAEATARADASDPGAAFFGFARLLIDEGATKRDLIAALAAAGVQPRIAGSPPAVALRAALGGLLQRAQAAGAVRTDVSVAEVLAVLSGAALAVREHPAAAERSVTVVCDGLRLPR